MDNTDDIQDLAGYLSVKEAARALGISARRLYRHIEHGRVRAIPVANVLVIPEAELQKIRYGVSGRPRQKTPDWRISPANDVHSWLHIFVLARDECGEEELAGKMETIRKNGAHIFPGTAARYVVRSDQRPNEVQIVLVWRGSMIPTPEAREAELEGLRRELADVLDWTTARYETGQVVMHT